MDVVLHKHKDYCSGMWIAMKKCRGFYQQISPNYSYKGALINWCIRNGYKIIKEV